MPSHDTWPALPLDSWRDTYATLHMWSQVVGKVCLAATPLTNHYWNIAFHMTSRGFTTPVLRSGDRTFAIAFDFQDHELVLQVADGPTERMRLVAMSVADFYAAVMRTLDRAGVGVRIWPMPVEIPNPIRFDKDAEHHTYDPASTHAFWQVLVACRPVFEQFRAEFLGKCSPVHFFWGSFDLAVTRFSGRRAPERPGADPITREAYSHEVISHGFWPGSGAVQEPAFYAYAAPEPEGLKDARVRPRLAYYHREMSEFILPYEAVRTSATPADDLLAFLTSTYECAADLAKWNRADVERRPT